MTGNVLVVGAVNVDSVVAVAHLPGPGETVVGPRVDQHGGGKGANAAVAAARSGATVRYCGAVGSDGAGADALADLRAEGIDVDEVAILHDHPTGAALIVVDARGENQIAVGAGANAAVDPESVRAAVDRAADWAGCVLVSSEITPAAVVAAVESAAAHGLRCVLNTAPVLPEMEVVLPWSPIVTPNETELADLFALLAGSRRAHLGVEHTAGDVASRTGAPVVVTLGGAGVLVVDPDGGSESIAPLPVDVRDTTGAGDTFNGVFAHGLARGLSVVGAARRGAVAASLSVRVVGARAGMPRAAAIDDAVRG